MVTPGGSYRNARVESSRLASIRRSTGGKKRGLAALVFAFRRRLALCLMPVGLLLGTGPAMSSRSAASSLALWPSSLLGSGPACSPQSGMGPSCAPLFQGPGRQASHEVSMLGGALTEAALTGPRRAMPRPRDPPGNGDPPMPPPPPPHSTPTSGWAGKKSPNSQTFPKNHNKHH